MGNDQEAVKAGYKRTEVGVIPEDWEVVKFNEIFTIISGVGFKKSEYTSDGLKLIRIDNVSYGVIQWDTIAYLPEKYSEYYSNIVLKEGDILLALNRPITNGQLKIALLGEGDVPAILYQRVGRIQQKNNFVDMLYSYYMLTVHIKNFVEGSSVGTDQPFISTVQLKKLQLPLPPTKTEQTAIAKTLSDTDALITSLNELIHKKEQIKQGTMQQLLTGKVRLQGFGEGKGVKQTELGVIPEDWDIAKIGSLLSIVTGNKNTQDNIKDGEYPFFVRSQTIEKINSFSFNCEAVLTAGDGVGTGKIFHYINGKFDVHQRVYVMNNFRDSLVGKYFYLYFSFFFYDRISSMTAKSSVDSVRKEMISNMPITVPPHEEQLRISDALFSIDTDIQTLKQRLAKTKALKQGMMQELLTGKTRLLPENKAK